jgi:D-alanyl-D-alanine carboxypeptidase
MRFLLRLIGTIFVATALFACSGGETAPRNAELQLLLDNVVSQGSPGSAAYIADPTRGEWAQVSGNAAINPDYPMDADRAFRIASITKTFTAAGIMLLRDDGLLPGIDVPIRNYVADLNIPKDDVITIRMLLGHTSGMADHENDPTPFQALQNANWLRVWRPEELVPFAIDYQLQHPEIFNYAPGAQFRYSNTGYVVLAMIIERITGKSYGQYITQRILIPFGLTRTFPADGPYLPAPYAHGYVILGGTTFDCSDSNESWDLGAGGMISTMQNLARWMTLLIGGFVVSPQSLQEMMTKGPNGRYGLGLEYNNVLGWGHNGSTPGYISVAIRSGNPVCLRRFHEHLRAIATLHHTL